MTSLLSFSLQALLLSVLVIVFCLHKRSLDMYVGAVVIFWLISVILIYARFGTEQIFLYSNDQEIHLRILKQYIPNEGIPFNFEKLIAWRYLVTLPVYFFSLFGLNSILLLKLQQLVYLIFTYKLGHNFLIRHNIKPKVWHVGLFVGPIMIFMSTLALRDLAIGFFTALFIIHPQQNHKLIGIIGTFLLRPHLAVALIIGTVMAKIFAYIQPKFFLFAIFIFTIGLYWFGALGYFIGNSVLNQVSLGSAVKVFTQYKFTRLAANFLGLQFLTLNESVVSASTTVLLSTRLIFIDSWLTPLLFIVFLVKFSYRWNQLRLQIYFAFIFFYGLTSQTSWNSSRQNIPFLISMGLLAVTGIESRRQTTTAEFGS